MYDLMRSTREFCVECHRNFGIVDRSPKAPSTCVDCYAGLRPSVAGECDECRRVIQIGEQLHLEWACLCGKCAETRSRQNSSPYRCTKATH
jgi:hypothetical protein